MAKKTLTKEQWEDLSKQYSFDLLIDGKKITVQLQRSNMKLFYMVYVDGAFKYEWLQDRAFAKKYFCLKKSAVNSTKHIKDVEKTFGKRSIKKHFPNLYKKLGYYTPYFTSFNTLKRTFEANNDSIEFYPVDISEIKRLAKSILDL